MNINEFSELQDHLNRTIVCVRFTTKSGKLREMYCTTNDQIIPKEQHVVSTSEVKIISLVKGFVVYDLDKMDYRSFIPNRIIDYVLSE